MNSKYVYHITSASDWEKQSQEESYIHQSLETEGFIHCATLDQVAGVLDRYFKGAKDLLRLKIEVSKLTSKLIMEQSTNDELFPHIFGMINKDAIVEVEAIEDERPIRKEFL